METKPTAAWTRLVKRDPGESEPIDLGPGGAEGVRLAWELSLEQWVIQGEHDPVQSGLQRSAVVLGRR